MPAREPVESLDGLLELTLQSLDVPPELQAAAAEVYERLAAWVEEHDAHDGRRDPDIFPQGSAALGTTTMPITEDDDWDIDAVYVRPIARESTTQETLKAEAGDVLRGFVDHERAAGRPTPTLTERDRCWRLAYEDFHIDVLPAIPEHLRDDNDTALLIADRDPQQREWIETDPKGYIEWFFGRMGETWANERQAIAERTFRAAADVPTWEIRTILQRVVQLTRRHRDLDFLEDDEMRPASILVTTVAARAYQGERTITEALRVVAAGLSDPSIVEERDGDPWVSNPTNADENLAREMVGDPARYRRFKEWVRRFQGFVSHVAKSRGAGLHRILTESLGERPVRLAVARLATERTQLRDGGQLRMAAKTGTLGVAGAVSVAAHTFHGPSKTSS